MIDLAETGEQVKHLGNQIEAMALAMSEIMDGACALTCREAFAIEMVMRAAGHDEEADAFINYHAYGDEDEDDMHHARYLELNNQ